MEIFMLKYNKYKQTEEDSSNLYLRLSIKVVIAKIGTHFVFENAQFMLAIAKTLSCYKNIYPNPCYGEFL